MATPDFTLVQEVSQKQEATGPRELSEFLLPEHGQDFAYWKDKLLSEKKDIPVQDKIEGPEGSISSHHCSDNQNYCIIIHFVSIALVAISVFTVVHSNLIF